MPNERTIPSEASKSVCTFTILSGGNAVSRTYQVLAITVTKEINRIPAATIILVDGEPSQQTFAISNTADFEPGKEIEIKAGYRSNEKTIFKGMVIRHGIKVRKSSSVLVVECKDKSVKMTVSSKSKYFKEMKDSDVIEQLIDAHHLDKEVIATSLQHKELVQYNTTDWDFMLCRVDANGLLCMPNDGKLTVARPDFAADAVLTVQYGATVHDLDAEIDARFQLKGVKATAWNPAQQSPVDGIEAADAGVPEAGNLAADTLSNVIGDDDYVLRHSGNITDQELQQWANAKLLKHRLAKIRGRVSTDGTADVLPGKSIRINGAGDRFNGKLFVTGVRHEIQKGNWLSVFQFGLEPEWFAQTYHVQQPMAGALLPAVQGLQIGVVTKLENDPDGEDRIMVRLPLIDTGDEFIWSRVCSLDAGDNRGMFFRPEIGDEVIVGFINNDPRHAVILGMCNSSKKPAPLPGSDQNHEKGYVSRSAMKMIFNDDKKTISIETPAGNKVLISEEDKTIKMQDQNGNKFTMDENGIKLESIKDLVLKATNDFNAEGLNTTVKSDAQMKVQGGSSAEVSSGGSTSVKGSMVQIN